jgi:hypothetical protein
MCAFADPEGVAELTAAAEAFGDESVVGRVSLSNELASVGVLSRGRPSLGVGLGYVKGDHEELVDSFAAAAWARPLPNQGRDEGSTPVTPSPRW